MRNESGINFFDDHFGWAIGHNGMMTQICYLFLNVSTFIIILLLFHHYIFVSFTSGKIASFVHKDLDQQDPYQPVGTEKKVQEKHIECAKTAHHKNQHKETLLGQKLEIIFQVLYLCEKNTPKLSNKTNAIQYGLLSWILDLKKDSSKKLGKLVK